MKGLKTDNQNNLVISHQHSLEFVEDIDKTAQDVRNILGFYKGEDPFDVNAGINWTSEVLGKATKENIEDVIAQRIAKNPEVYRVKKVEIKEPKEGERDILEIETEIETVYGVLNV